MPLIRLLIDSRTFTDPQRTQPWSRDRRTQREQRGTLCVDKEIEVNNRKEMNQTEIQE